jgi:hypothetical protein
MVPENHQQLEADKLHRAKEREQIMATTTITKKQSKETANPQVLAKLNEVYKLDRMMYA